MKQASRIMWGIVLVALGVIYSLNALNITDIDLFFKGWWTLIIIIPSFISVLTDNDKTGGIIGLIAGLVLLLACRGYVDFKMIGKLAIPLLIIYIGLTLIFKDAFTKETKKAMKNLKNSGPLRSCTAILSSKKDDSTDETFGGASYTAIFGTVDSDITRAFYEKDVIIKAKNVLGNVIVRVPSGVNVKVTSHSLFGGVKNPVQNNESNVVTIYIEAYCLLGNVEVIG